MLRNKVPERKAPREGATLNDEDERMEAHVFRRKRMKGRWHSGSMRGASCGERAHLPTVEDTFYEKGNDIAKRIAELVARNKPEDVPRSRAKPRHMQLRHVPLFLVRELARRKSAGRLVAETIEHVIQRADELGEFVALYWKARKERSPPV